jgi:hypothetical protein
MKRDLIIIIILSLFLGGVFLFVTKSSPSKQPHHDAMNAQQTINKDYSMQLLSPKKIVPEEQTEIRYKIMDTTGAVLKDFSVEHDNIMHFISVRTDLQDFQHVHPDYNKNTHEFSTPIVFPGNGTYRLLADFTPAQTNEGITTTQDITVGDATAYDKQEVKPDMETTKTEGDYEFTYDIPETIQAGKPTTILITVNRNGQPLKDMEKYLGAQAHGILFKKDMLDFAHLHAMGEEMTHVMDGKTMTMQGPLPTGPEIMFSYTFPSPGIYKLFTQFQVAGEVITTDYTFLVKK